MTRQLNLPALSDRLALAAWFRERPLQWSAVIAARSALRVLPLGLIREGSKTNLALFRAASIARFAARHPNSVLEARAVKSMFAAANQAEALENYVGSALSFAARTAAEVAAARYKTADASAAFTAAATAVGAAGSAIQDKVKFFENFTMDVEHLVGRSRTFEQLADSPLWFGTLPSRHVDEWPRLASALIEDGSHWSVWTNWYQDVLTGRHHTEIEDLCFTDITKALPWDLGREAVNSEIASRLAANRPDPEPIEGIESPIAISVAADGRIDIGLGPLSLPTVLTSANRSEHLSALSACRSRAAQLLKTARSSSFQHRTEYAQALSDYLDWLPDGLGSGNMLLADGEVRILNKLFTADEGILSAGFASALSVLLEDHIGLRSFYPEVERHYHSISTGRLVKPLPRDAVEAIHEVIRAQTPVVFTQSVSPAIGEAAKPFPIIPVHPPEDVPHDPNRPKPPNDPIGEADPRKSKNYILASAFNRIWSILKNGKDAAQGVDGWKKTYDLLKPHMPQILEFLRGLFPGGGSGGAPPSISI